MLDKVADSVFITQSCTIQANRGWIANYATISYWCSKPDLNRHALRQKFLRLSWLPISPFEHITHLCIPTSAASQGFVLYKIPKTSYIHPTIRSPQTRLLGQRDLTKPQRRLVYFFQSNKRSCLLLQKPPFLLPQERKVESLSCKLILLLIFRTEKCLRQKSAEKVLIILLGLKDLQKAGTKGGT